jgi:D-alanine-D-alanine ligase
MEDINRKKIKIAIVHGGRSKEHNVSVESGQSIIESLAKNNLYEVFPVLIDKEGKWFLKKESLKQEEVFPSTSPNEESNLIKKNGDRIKIDVFFPILHGRYGEDGTIQGLFELSGSRFIGSDCRSSAISIDKAVTKAILRSSGLPVLPFISFTSKEWKEKKEEILMKLENTIETPLFIKPVDQGSSFGVNFVREKSSIQNIIEKSFEFDDKIMIEEFANGREIECAILENRENNPSILASPLMEIIPKSEWYDFDSKYTDGMADLIIPANLDESTKNKIQEYAKSAFRIIGCSDLARVDFFYREAEGEIFINEVNTLPGFTKLSGFPKMIDAAGISYESIIEILIKNNVK